MPTKCVSILTANYIFRTLISKINWRKSFFPSSVTKLGDFYLLGKLFSLGIFLKITEVAQICGLLFLAVKIMN
jgi:hypothetical protein